MTEFFDLIDENDEGGADSYTIAEKNQHVGRFEVGFYVDDQSLQLKKLRNALDILAPLAGYRKMDNPEVKSWLQQVGDLDHQILGKKTGPKSVFGMLLRRFKDELINVTPLGESMHVSFVESATQYSDYALEAHRLAVTREAYGELPEPDVERQRLVEDYEIQDTPFWWRNIYIGKFCNRTTKFRWLDDIRISREVGGSLFATLSDFGPYWLMADRPKIKEFRDRWYNDPKRLTWRKIGYGNKQRWAGGMVIVCPKTVIKYGKEVIKKGDYVYLWAPMSYRSSQYFDWRKKQETEEGDPTLVRTKAWRRGTPTLTKGDKTIAFKKRHRDVLVRYLTADPQTGLYAIWRMPDGSEGKSITYSEARSMWNRYVDEGWKPSRM